MYKYTKFWLRVRLSRLFVNSYKTKLEKGKQLALDFYQELIFVRIRLKVSGLIPNTEAIY